MSAENVEGSKLSVVKGWLAKHPKRATSLVLVVKDEEGEEVLLEEELQDLTPLAAQQVIAAVDSRVEADERDVHATLRWLDKQGRPIQSRRLRRKYTGEASTAPMTGSMADQAAQAQRLLKDVMKLNHDGLTAANQQVVKLATTALDALEKISGHFTRTLEENSMLRDQVQDLVVTRAEEVVRQTEEDEEKEEKGDTVGEQALKLLGPVLLKAVASEPAKAPASSAGE